MLVCCDDDGHAHRVVTYIGGPVHLDVCADCRAPYVGPVPLEAALRALDSTFRDCRYRGATDPADQKSEGQGEHGVDARKEKRTFSERLRSFFDRYYDAVREGRIG